MSFISRISGFFNNSDSLRELSKFFAKPQSWKLKKFYENINDAIDQANKDLARNFRISVINKEVTGGKKKITSGEELQNHLRESGLTTEQILKVISVANQTLGNSLAERINFSEDLKTGRLVPKSGAFTEWMPFIDFPKGADINILIEDKVENKSLLVRIYEAVSNLFRKMGLVESKKSEARDQNAKAINKKVTLQVSDVITKVFKMKGGSPDYSSGPKFTFEGKISYDVDADMFSFTNDKLSNFKYFKAELKEFLSKIYENFIGKREIEYSEVNDNTKEIAELTNNSKMSSSVDIDAKLDAMSKVAAQVTLMKSDGSNNEISNAKELIEQLKELGLSSGQVLKIASLANQDQIERIIIGLLTKDVRGEGKVWRSEIDLPKIILKVDKNNNVILEVSDIVTKVSSVVQTRNSKDAKLAFYGKISYDLSSDKLTVANVLA